MAVSESMAVDDQIKTKSVMRKRKVLDGSGDVQENCKKAKEQDDSTNQIDEGENPPKKITFSIAEFRSQLRGVDGLKFLRNFANCAEWKTTENDVVLEYLQSGGSLSEITSLLDVTAQADLATALPVFRAVYLILLKIQSEGKEYQNESRQSVENLLGTFVPAMQAMITLNSAKHRKVVLKMLTSIVTLQPSLGRQILNWFSLSPVQQEQFAEPGAVRKAFVMFLMAFFVEGKASLFRPLIEKKGLLSSIMPNLKYDDAKTVAVVLTVLKEKMLMNPGVAKTLKLNIFNTQAIQSLFQLYNWMGPKGVKKSWKEPKKMATVDDEDLALVTSALDEFLLLLCTCRKHGVIFWDKSLGSGLRMNQVIFTALEVIPKPWEKPETCRLVVKILEASPDLIKSCLLRWEPSFEPRESLAWVQAVDFLIEVFNSLRPETLVQAALEVLQMSQIQGVLNGLLLSPCVIKHLTAALNPDKTLGIRCHGLRLLAVIINKSNSFISVISSHVKGTTQMKKNISLTINAIIPLASSICEMWMAPEIEVASPLQLSTSKDEVIAEFLLASAQLEPSLLDNPHKLCKTLINDINERKKTVQSAVFQTIALLDPSFLKPDSEQFEAALKIIMFLSAEQNTRRGSLCALATMLLSTDLWNEESCELDCWLGSWLRVPDKSRPLVAQVLVKAIRRAAQAKNSEEDTAASVLNEAFAVSDEMGNEMKKSEKAELKRFLSNVALQLGCIYSYKLEITPEHEKWLSCNIQLCLQGHAAAKTHPLEIHFLGWLYSADDKILDLTQFQPDMFMLSSLFTYTINYLREKIKNNNFDNEVKARVLSCIETIVTLAGPNDLPRAQRLRTKILALDFTSSTFLNKAASLIFEDPLFIKQFQVIGDSELTNLLKDIVGLLKLNEPQRLVDEALFHPFKNRLLKHLKKLIKMKDSSECLVSTDLHFWAIFLSPTVEELTPVFKKLCARNLNKTDQSSTSSELGSVWLATLRVVSSQNVPRILAKGIVQHLCRAVVLPFCQPEYEDALLEFIQTFPFLVLDIPSDFLKGVLHRKKCRDNLIKVAEMSILKKSQKETFVDSLCGSTKKVNGRVALALVGSILQWPDVLSYAVNEPKEKNYETLQQSLYKRIVKTIPTVCKRAQRSLISFICGKDDNLMMKHLPFVLVIIQEYACKCGLDQKIVEAVGNKIPRVETMAALATMPISSCNLIPAWLPALCSEPSPGSSWQKQAEVLQSLVRDEFLKYFVDFRQTETWAKYLNTTLRGLNTAAEPHRLAIIRSVTAATWSEGADNKELAAVFHKCTSHSEFLAIMLSNSPVKEQLIDLILTLVRLWPPVMILGHVPVYLAAYNGSLSSCDQKILELLRIYERHCGSLSKFDPLVWGQAAITHYSVQGNSGLSLWKQVTMKSILEQLDFDKMKNTIAQFPIHRALLGGVGKSLPDVYDPSFLLPLFSNLFSPGAVSYCLSFIHQGALSLTIAALSSTDAMMRGAAAVVLSRFYAHLQLTQHSKQKPVWLHIVDCIRYSVDNLDTTPIPGIGSVFLARAVLEIADPLAPLHSIHRFLLAKPVFNLRVLPEFLPLFFSEDTNYAVQRKWILEVIRDGIRQDVDLNLVLKSPAYNILLTSFFLSTTTTEIKVLVLEVLKKLVEIGPGSKALFNEFGLVSWMRNASGTINGPLSQPFAALLKVIIQYSLNKQQKSDKLCKDSSCLLSIEATLGRFLSGAANVSVNDICSGLLY